MAEHPRVWASEVIDLLLEVKHAADTARAAGHRAVDADDQRRFRHYYEERVCEGGLRTRHRQEIRGQMMLDPIATQHRPDERGRVR